MAIDFDALKNNRKSSFDKLTGELQKMTNAKFDNNTDIIWKPDVDKAGNGYAVIRFLPAPAGEDIPFVRIFDHGFQGPGGWYIEKSLTTLGQPDPLSEYNSQLWNSGVEASKELARKQKRRLSYYSNIYVVSDPNRPQNEGKVFIFKYGKKLYEKINEAIHPPFDDQGRSPEHPNYDPSNAFNPFDLWEGANFKLKIRKVEGYQNYDKSEFERPAPLLNDDDALRKIWESEHSLQELLNPKNFKSYSELKARLEKVLNTNVSAGSHAGRVMADDDDEEEAFPVPQKTAAVPEVAKTAAPWSNDDEDDEDLSFFKKLAKN